MKISTQILLKLILITIIVLFALFNYRFITLDKGLSKTSLNDMSVKEAITTLTGITKIEYYERPGTVKHDDDIPQPINYKRNDYIYRVYIETTNDAYLLKATQNDINAFEMLGILDKSLKPNKIKPIHYIFEIIIGFLILIIPFGIPKNQPNRQ